MKLAFSEHVSDYAHYVFPYAVWAFPEPGETPAQLFDAGFLPSGRRLDRFYLCRQIRVDLRRFHPSSENRRILRKGAGLAHALVPREEFAWTPERRDFCLRYAERRFGVGVMSAARLDGLMASPLVTHVLVFTDSGTGVEVGLATLYVEEDALAFYSYAFYDPAWLPRNLGMFMMTTAVMEFARRGCRHLYLGTCYAPSALYKTQFAGVEFFNGFRWSGNLAELKHLLRRDQPGATMHLLESPEYAAAFPAHAPEHLPALTRFRAPLV